MKKRTIWIAVIMIMMFMVFGLVACNVSDNIQSLRTAGKAEIDTHVATLTATDYSTANWAEIEQIIADGKIEVDKANNKAEVDKAVDNTIKAIDAVQEEREMADFVLTISVDKNTKNRGEDFVVEVSLKNQSGEDTEIATGYTYNTTGMGPTVQLFSPQIEGWMFLSEPSDTMPGEANFETITDAGQCKTIFYLGSFGLDADYNEASLPKGTHDLRFRATFCLNWGAENQQELVIWSNTIKLTVK